MKLFLNILVSSNAFFMESPTKSWWYSDQWNSEKRLLSVRDRWNEFHDVFPVGNNLEKLFDVSLNLN